MNYRAGLDAGNRAQDFPVFVHGDGEAALEGGIRAERAQQAGEVFQVLAAFGNDPSAGSVETAAELRDMIDAPLQDARRMVCAVRGAGTGEFCGE